MLVVATAGHVDHGKSTLVRALTGMDPDRWAEEKRRQLTIDLGYAWTTLPDGTDLAVVDVPGHRRFIGNMLAGLGPCAAVLFVVAADGGWSAQSTEHLAAADALGLRHGILAVTRADLADPGPALAEASRRLRGSTLARIPALAVSARTGAGLAELEAALAHLAASVPRPDPDARVRLWVDRSFPIRGAGPVVTGTLEAGTLRVGQVLTVGGRRVRVRSLQSLGVAREEVRAASRVAVNLRGVEHAGVRRGDALLTPDAWHVGAELDLLLSAPLDPVPGHPDRVPTQLTVHLGSAAIPARARRLGPRAVRVRLDRPAPAHVGDRVILRDPGGEFLIGARVADPDPPPLRRRGAAPARAAALAAATGGVDLAAATGGVDLAAATGGVDLAAATGGVDPADATGGVDPVEELRRRGAVTRSEAARLGLPVERLARAPGARQVGDLLVSGPTWLTWAATLGQVARRHAAENPLAPWLALEAARRRAGLPSRQMAQALAAEAGLACESGRLRPREVRPDLGPAEAGLREWEARLERDPFAAPDQPRLAAAGLGPAQVAAAQSLGRLLQVGPGVVVLPSAPARALRLLADLPQPFTVGEARAALGATRRVVVPLLEHLDNLGWTRRVSPSHRETLS